MPDDPNAPAPAPIPGPTPTGYQRTQGGGFKWRPPTAEHLSRLLPQYDIECLLGHGGMGAVYKGTQKSLHRTVAIKILPPGLEDEDASYVERFKNEARIMARLDHPAIVPVYDFGETAEGQLYIVMSFVDGTDVQKMLQEQGRLPPEHALAVTAHVCDALKYAHEHGVIHRDIKPANVLINMEGAVKVADFGLAKANEPGTSGITRTGMAMGTPDYVAPETLVMGVDVDGRADLYAVGVMLYTMLTGNVPRGAFKPVSIQVPGTDPRFDVIVQKAMQMDREERYQSAKEIRHDLDVILTTPQVQAGGVSSAAIPKQSLPAKPVAKGPQQPQKKAGAAAANQKLEIGKQKPRAPLVIGIAAVLAIGFGAFFLRSSRREEAQSSARPPANPSLATSAATDGPRAPIKVRENPKPEPVAVVTPAKPEPPKPAPPRKEDPKPVVAAAPVMPAQAKPVVVAQAPAPPKIETPPPAPSPNLPPELAALDEQFTKLQAERVTAPFESDLAKLNTGYLGGIGKKIVEEKATGHLDGILALEAEQKLVASSGTRSSVADGLRLPIEATMPVPDADDDKTPASLKALRGIYRTAYAKLEATRAANLKALTDPLDARLAAMETSFTKADRLADAKVVRGYREALSESNAGLKPAQLTTTGNAAEGPPARGDGLKPLTTLNPAAMLALKDGITNTLGMKFLPVKGTEVLFCIHETRYKDYAAYAADAPGVDGSWKDQSADGFTPTDRPEDHPVMKVSWEDAQKFCAWLSQKEGKTYRLPTDEEWSIAVGLGRKEKHGKNITPAMLSGKESTEFPWGDDFPPETKDQAGNYSDASRKAKAPRGDAQYLEDYDDGFPTTAPVMSFKPNKNGLYDLGGNVWEWCEDWYDNAQKDRVLRGGSRYIRRPRHSAVVASSSLPPWYSQPLLRLPFGVGGVWRLGSYPLTFNSYREAVENIFSA